MSAAGDAPADFSFHRLMDAEERARLAERALRHSLYRNHAPHPESCDGCADIERVLNPASRAPAPETKA